METVEYTAPQGTHQLPSDYMLTTYDNPYDPFTQFEQWKTFDEQVMHYCTCGLIDRMALTSDELSDRENDLAIDHAVIDILNMFPGLYRTVERKV